MPITLHQRITFKFIKKKKKVIYFIKWVSLVDESLWDIVSTTSIFDNDVEYEINDEYQLINEYFKK
jgi:hypothetical protein